MENKNIFKTKKALLVGLLLAFLFLIGGKAQANYRCPLDGNTSYTTQGACDTACKYTCTQKTVDVAVSCTSGACTGNGCNYVHVNTSTGSSINGGPFGDKVNLGDYQGLLGGGSLAYCPPGYTAPPSSAGGFNWYYGQRCLYDCLASCANVCTYSTPLCQFFSQTCTENTPTNCPLAGGTACSGSPATCTKSGTCTYVAPPTCLAYFNPGTINSGDNSTFYYQSSADATGATIDCGSGPVGWSTTGGAFYTTLITNPAAGLYTCTYTVSGAGGSTPCPASLTVNPAQCGSSAGQVFASPGPTSNLCNSGTPSGVSIYSGSTPQEYHWTCSGVACVAYVAAGPLNASCGTANGQTLSSAPSAPTDLCRIGTPTAVSGTGPWTWTCQGINFGTNASCSANLGVPPPPVCSPNGCEYNTCSPATCSGAGCGYCNNTCATIPGVKNCSLQPPSNLGYTCSVDGTQATLAWTPAPGANSAAYRLYDSTLAWRGDCVGDEKCSGYIYTPTASAVVTGLTPNKTYAWWMQSISGSTWSAAVGGPPITCSNTVPGAPVNLNATCSADNKQATISWNPVAGATSYGIRINHLETPVDVWDGSCAAPDSCPTWSTNSYTFPVISGDTYSWWVHAINNAGWSAPTSGLNFKCTVPSCVTGCVAGTTTVCSANCGGGTQTCTMQNADCTTTPMFPLSCSTSPCSVNTDTNWKEVAP